MSEDALISYILNKIDDLFTEKISLIWRVADDVESLKQELQALVIFLNNMDYKQRQDAGTKNWLSSVRDVAYEADDLIDAYTNTLEKRYVPATRIFHSNTLQKDIKQLKSKIREIVERRTIYIPKLHEQRGKGSSSSTAADQGHLHLWRRSFPDLGDDVVVGFEHDANLIVKRLLHSEGRRQVVAITGMGGVGKTTLAAVVYKLFSKAPVRGHAHFAQLKEVDSGGELQNHFDACDWVPAHQDPNIMDLLLIMIDQLGLSEYVEGKEYRRYLIVLDDIWRKEVWDQLKATLPNSSNGSRIIVTTRFKDAAIYHDPGSEPYEMRPLNEDDSWRLFLTKVFPQDQPTCPRELEDLGRQLCRKCAGLPLALVVLGGLDLIKQKHLSLWSKLPDSMNWDLTDNGKQCLEILALSYYDLPYNMKFCFLYLGAFPQGSEISASKLTKLWIGDELIPKEGITLEGTATKYLEELTQRVLELDGFTKNNIPEPHINDMTRLRYLGLRDTNFAMLPISGGIPPHLQTLDIRGTSITELPSEVWTLTKLRHLYLSSVRLLNSQALRSGIPLHNLQTLKIDDYYQNTRNNQLVGCLKLLSSLNTLTLRANEIPQKVFTATSTHAKLHKLKLDGTLQPDELCGIENFAPNITELTLSRSNLQGEPTQTLGQLKNLRILKLRDDACQCENISCSPGSFPNLSYLELSNLCHLALLNIEPGSFPNLMHLSIHRCDNLHVVPNGLDHITTLQVLECKEMPSSFVKEINDWRRTHPTVRVIISDRQPPQDLSPTA
ncbi:putative disease resistance protein At1g50180 [Ananas comosus]|uniref:Disease resistance protein At1g50180 n=1 Tax=Ananas comosus TaxID=4615 RepID=A0A6P5H355_ANACO|nr:putative disease resistance protein At1g50180 [Ananas comosus]